MSLISAGGGDRRAKESENREWLARAAKDASIYDVHIILGFCLYCLFANSVHFFNPPPVCADIIYMEATEAKRSLDKYKSKYERGLDGSSPDQYGQYLNMFSFLRSVGRSFSLFGRTNQATSSKKGEKEKRYLPLLKLMAANFCFWRATWSWT